MRYRDLLDELQRQIISGELRPGDKLPPQRELAWRRGCSVATVTRAYKELERLGLADGQVGRGTYVLGPSPDEEQAASLMPRHCIEDVAPGAIEFSVNTIVRPAASAAIARAMKAVAARVGPHAYAGYFDSRARPTDRDAAVRWLTETGQDAQAEQLLIAPGAQSALFASVLSFAGDAPVAVEELSYPGFRAAIAFAGRRAAGLELDGYGLVPDAFERACVEHGVKLLITAPTVHNPTGATQTEERRREIATIAREHGVVIVEDGVYDFLNPGMRKGYREIAPENTVYVTSFAKSVSASLRVAYITGAPRLLNRLSNALVSANWMTSAILLDIADELILSGAMSALCAETREEAAQRQRHVLQRFAGRLAAPGTRRNNGESVGAVELPVSLTSQEIVRTHFWMSVPGDANPAAFADAAHAKGLKIAPAGAFAVRRNVRAEAFRVATMAAEDRASFEKGLDILDELYQTNACVEMACV